MKTAKNIYFASDFHLGLPSFEKGIDREKLVVAWLDSIKNDASEIFLVGDIFDFWYEYKYVIPKGFTRFQGKIAELTDSGIPVHFFTGNHDVWMFNYFPRELGVSVHTQPIARDFNGKRFLIGHGDGLGKGDNGYKLLKGIFTSKVLQWLFSRLHPNFAMWLGNGWSVNSRYSKEIAHKFRGESELITRYARWELEQKSNFQFFVFGHWHSPVVYPLTPNETLVLLGDWIVSNTYAKWDGEKLELLHFKKNGESELVSKR